MWFLSWVSGNQTKDQNLSELLLTMMMFVQKGLGPISTQVSKVYTLLDKVRLSEFRRGRQEIAEGKYGQQKFLKSSQTSIMENKSSIHPPH